MQLDINNLKLFTLVNASFANNKNISLQIGYVIILGNKIISNDRSFKIRSNVVY